MFRYIVAPERNIRLWQSFLRQIPKIASKEWEHPSLTKIYFVRNTTLSLRLPDKYLLARTTRDLTNSFQSTISVTQELGLFSADLEPYLILLGNWFQ